VSSIHRVNEFMGTERSAELVENMASATHFDKMKEKKFSEPRPELKQQVFILCT